MEIECLGCGGALSQASRSVQVCVGAVLLALALIAIFSDSGPHAAIIPSGEAPQSAGPR